MSEITPKEAQKMCIEYEFKKSLIERTKNYGVKKNDNGGVTHSCKLSHEGSIYAVIHSEGRDKAGAIQAAKFYKIGRDAWLKGDFETVADLFGVLV